MEHTHKLAPLLRACAVVCILSPLAYCAAHVCIILSARVS